MLTQKDVKILAHLRNNARKKITSISREMQMPVTTVYDKLKKYEKDMIKKHITLFDFNRFGFNTKMQLAIKVSDFEKKELQQFLTKKPNVNSLYRVDYGFNFLVECVFRNLGEAEDFIEILQNNFKIQEIKRFHIVDELLKENFLSKPEHFDVLE